MSKNNDLEKIMSRADNYMKNIRKQQLNSSNNIKTNHQKSKNNTKSSLKNKNGKKRRKSVYFKEILVTIRN